MGLTQIQSEGIGDGEVKGADLENSGVSAGTYGSSSAIPAITVDAKGRITSASTNSITQVGGSNAVDFNDNVKARFGTSNDLEIFHDGSNSYIKDVGAGGLILETNGHAVDIKHGSEYCARFKEDADVELYYDNSVKLETKSDGVNIIGELECDSLDVDGGADISGTLSLHSHLDMQDDDRIRLGSGDDFELYHNGTQNLVTSAGQTLEVRASTFLVTNSDGTENVLKGISDGACELYQNGSKKFETTSSGVNVTGTVTCDGLTSDGAINCASGVGQVNIQDTNNTGTACQAEINFKESDGTTQGYVGYANTNSSTFFIANVESNAGITFLTQNVSRVSIQGDGHLVPQANNTYDLGTSSNRWRNVYTNDLNLSNEGSANDVDGTWGNYTIQEGEDDLFLINRRNGKKYKFNLTEVN